MPITNRIANRQREKSCFNVTAERKYYELDRSFVKRSLRPSEWQVSESRGTIHVPRLGNERLHNEAAVLELVRKETNIPVPQVYACFDDDNATYLIVERIFGVGMNEISQEQHSTVAKELEKHLETLHKLRARVIGGPTGIVIPPYRAMTATPRPEWIPRASENEEFVLCHNDLSQYNVIVDPDTLKIRAIVDWECAGFYPEWFEKRFFERPGPSVIREKDQDDTPRIIEF